MAKNYPSPVVPNPFRRNPPIVTVVRHARFTAASETVLQDPNQLVRHFNRIDNKRVYPPLAGRGPLERNVPENLKKKTVY